MPGANSANAPQRASVLLQLTEPNPDSGCRKVGIRPQILLPESGQAGKKGTEVKKYPGLHQRQGKEGDSCPILCSCETPPAGLCPTLGVPTWEGAAGVSPEETTKIL